MRLSVTKIVEGQRVPWWRGVAYYEWDTQCAVVYPYGLHIIVGLLRRCWFWIKMPFSPNKDWVRAELLRSEYTKGMLDERTWWWTRYGQSLSPCSKPPLGPPPSFE